MSSQPSDSNSARLDSRRLGPARCIALWFGTKERVTPRAYIVSGFGLMLLKYATEALAVWQFTGRRFSVLDFLNPVLSTREELLRPAPEWLGWAWFVWSLPFLWIAVSMSVRRAADAGNSPWLGLMVVVPVLNLVFMLTMCFLPSKHGDSWAPSTEEPSDLDRKKSAAFGIGLSLLVGGAMLFLSVYAFSTYGASLFLGTPLLMSATAAYVYNRSNPRTAGSSAVVGLLSVAFAGLALLLFALEGVVCVLMAAPLILPIGLLGGLLGKAIADATRVPPSHLAGAIAVLPLLAWGESMLAPSHEFVVTTTIEVDVAPEVVWNHVIAFPDLPRERPWYFSWGIACPERARIVGNGLGATRYCEFTTGAFVEPITVWEEPTRLAFDITSQPEPMLELSPYEGLHPPHLDGFLISKRGEFKLVPLPAGRTRVEGRTWYAIEMYPQWYWINWTDSIIHRIHQRVLLHIKNLSERRVQSIST